jgi:hypothetical protein
MSRWGKPRKNKKFIDPRYFMDEKMETIKETQDSDRMQEIAGVGSGTPDPRQRRTPHGAGQRVENVDMAEAQELAQVLAQSPAVMAAVQQAVQDSKVQAAVEEAEAEMQGAMQEGSAEDRYTDMRDSAMPAAVGGVAAGAVAAHVGLMGSIGMVSAATASAATGVGIPVAVTLLTVAFGILVYKSLAEAP